MAIVKEIMEIMEDMAPLSLSEDWDNSGLLLGNPQSEVKKILVALDATETVIEEAISTESQMIITHHPLLFRPVKKITTETPLGRNLFRLIQHGINVYCAHTNLDIAFGGTNDVLAELIGLTQIQILKETAKEEYRKIAVYVPLSHSEKLQKAMCEAGAGSIGNYSQCTFLSKGTGTFLPQKGTNPFIGQEEKLETVTEIKLETIAPKKQIPSILQAMFQSHPYEEVAYDIYPVEQSNIHYGIGRIGILPFQETLESLALRLKKKIGLKTIRITGDKNKMVKTVGLCTGSGIEFLEEAENRGADVYITGDLKFHDAQRALEKGISVIDATHYASENCMVPVLCEYIKEKSKCHGLSLQIVASKVNGQTFLEV